MTETDRTAWIREQLRQRGLRQKHLAAYLGIHQSAVTYMMKGERKITADEMSRIEAFFAAPVVVGRMGDRRINLDLPEGPVTLHVPADMSVESRAILHSWVSRHLGADA